MTEEQRSRNMRSIRGKDTSIEMMMRRELWSRGYRYRKNYSKLPGKPDIVLVKHRIAVFCDGEFFHGKDWDVLEKRLENGKNSGYWICKINRNIERDNEIDKMLDYLGWTVIRFWGDDIKKDVSSCVDAIEEIIFNAKIDLDSDNYVYDEK